LTIPSGGLTAICSLSELTTSLVAQAIAPLFWLVPRE